MLNYVQTHYTAPRVVIAGAGALDHQYVRIFMLIRIIEIEMIEMIEMIKNEYYGEHVE